MLIHGSEALYPQMYDTSHIITIQHVFIPALPLLLLLLSGGESIPVYSRLPRSVPADVGAALPGAVADTGLEGRLREGHNSLWSEEGHRV